MVKEGGPFWACFYYYLGAHPNFYGAPRRIELDRLDYAPCRWTRVGNEAKKREGGKIRVGCKWRGGVGWTEVR